MPSYPWTDYPREAHSLGNNISDPADRKQWLIDHPFRVTWVRASSQPGTYGWMYETRCFATEEAAVEAAKKRMTAFSVSVDRFQFNPDGSMKQFTLPLWTRKPKQELQRARPRRR